MPRTSGPVEEMDERFLQTDQRVRQFLIVAEAERQRLGQELHNEVSQLLAALSMRLNVLRDTPVRDMRASLDECLAITAQAIEQVREMSLDLSPSILADASLTDTVEYYLERQAQRAGLTVNLIVSSSWTPVAREVEDACLRVVQEAMINVVRHASARHVQVRLRQDAEEVDLSIRDDGVGFAPESCQQGSANPEMLGLIAMRQRVELLGGRCRIVSAPGQGTSIQVSLPVNAPGT